MISKKQKIVVLHGWTDKEKSLELWNRFNLELEKIGFDVIFLKLPHLLDQNKEESAWHLDNYLGWLDKKLTVIKNHNEPIILLGHSFGGQIACKYVADLQNNIESKIKISALILLDSAGLIDNRFYKVVKRNIFYGLSKIFAPLKQLHFLRKLVYMFIGEKDYYLANKVQQQTMHNVINLDITNSLHNIKVPTLIIWGSQDNVTPTYMAKIFAKKIQNSKLFFVDGAKHSPQFTHLSEVINIIKKFKDDLE